MSEYSEKLKSPKWQKKRLEILERDKFTCQLCLNEDFELQVHHKSYKFGNNPWDYPNDNFITLCKYCHGVTELLKKDGNIPIMCGIKHDKEYTILFVTCKPDNSEYIIYIYAYFDHNKIDYVIGLTESAISTTLPQIISKAKELNG